jgi:hypothetical protein
VWPETASASTGPLTDQSGAAFVAAPVPFASATETAVARRSEIDSRRFVMRATISRFVV